MKKILLLFIITVIFGELTAQARQDSISKGSMYFKSIKIIGNDTIVNERHIDLDDVDGSTNFFFRFGDNDDTLIKEQGNTLGLDFYLDSMMQRFISPFEKRVPLIPGDTSFNNFHFRIPDFNFPQGETFRFDFRDAQPEIFQIPNGRHQRGFTGRKGFPSFSVEDVEIYPEDNTVRNFEIRPLPGSNMFLVEAELDNKRTEYTVYNNRGETIYYERLRRIEGGDFRRVLLLDEISPGTYFVEIKNGRSTKKKRVIIR